MDKATKTVLTKADLLREVEQQHVALTSLRIGVVSTSQLCTILEVSEGQVITWKKDGMPTNKEGFLGLTYDWKLSSVVGWMIARARDEGRASVGKTAEGAEARKLVAEANLADTEAAAKNPLVTALEARIKELETELFHLKDDSVPPPLPQPVVDILYEASNLIDGNLDEVFALLQDEEDHPGFLDDLDGVVDSTKSLGVLKSRIRQALDIDAEWHSKIRLEASQEKLDAANASLAKTLAEAA